MIWIVNDKIEHLNKIVEQILGLRARGAEPEYCGGEFERID